MEQGRYGQLQNTLFWFLNKTDIYVLPHFYVYHSNQFCLYNLNLNFGTVSKIGRQGECTKNRETPKKI